MERCASIRKLIVTFDEILHEQIHEKRKLSPNMIAFREREQNLKNAYLIFNPESSVLYLNVEEHEFKHKTFGHAVTV